MKPTLTITIASCGRPSLARTLRSIRVQDLYDDDEVLLVGDGPQPQAQELFEQFGLPGRYLEAPKGGCWGHPARNWAQPQARGDFLLAIDDDDIYVPGALKEVRRRLDSPSLHVFRMLVVPENRTLWRRKALECGNVSTQMFAVPNVPGKLGTWEPVYGGDCAFAKACAEHFPPSWHDFVIAHVWPACQFDLA